MPARPSPSLLKTINDVHGHHKGDRVLRQLSRLVAQNIRASDWLVRWGGEEFLIILAHTDLNMTRKLAEKLRHFVECTDFGLGTPVTISLGICSCPPQASLQDCVRQADEALYRAKNAGRNQWAEAVADDTPSTGTPDSGETASRPEMFFHHAEKS